MAGRIEMNMNRTLTTFDSDPSDLAERETEQVLGASKERIQDLIRQSTLAVEEVLREIRETISKTEAEMEVTEKISVVMERDRTVLSVERNFRFAKDK